MSWRTVIVSRHAKLDLMVGFMQVRDNTTTRRIVLDEIDILIVESPAVAITAALLVELVARKVKVIFCDWHHNPSFELTPYHGCHDSSRRLRIQIGWKPECKKAVWRRIVIAKIDNQASVLRQWGLESAAARLESFVQEVESGDATNREGVAAKLYFKALFGEDFSRDACCDVNSALNYGYQVLMSVFAREISAEGFVSEIGIFHDNVYNQFNLASDLMEPFRPFVDLTVKKLFSDEANKFGKEIKRALVAMLHREVKVCGNRQTLINAAIQYTRSVTDILSGGEDRPINIPEYEY